MWCGWMVVEYSKAPAEDQRADGRCAGPRGRNERGRKEGWKGKSSERLIEEWLR